MSRVPTENIDYTSRDYEAYREMMINTLQEKMPEYTDLTETDAGIVIIEALANGLDILSLYADTVANDVILPTTQSRKIAVLIARCLGYTPYNQTASEYKQVFVTDSISDSESEILHPRITIPKGTVVRTKVDKDLNTLYFQTVEDLIIPENARGDEKDSNGNYIYTVKVVAGETVNQDVLGSSNGAPLQSFQTHYNNVLIDSIELYIDEGSGNELWTRVDTFFDCDADSKAYMVLVDEFDQCFIQFGNGLKGKIPTTYPNGISATYRVGGGEVSNVSAGEINTLDTGISYVSETFNLEADVLGHDKESLESIKINAPVTFRTRDRLVTLKDYEDLLLLNFYEFLDIQAREDSLFTREVHIYYIMKDGYLFNSDLALRVSEFISARSMIGCTYDIQSYVPDTVSLSCSLDYNNDYDVDTIKEQINECLAEIFRKGNVLFDSYLVKSDIETRVKSEVDGVYAFRINTPSSNIIRSSIDGRILTLGTVTINSSPFLSGGN